MVINNPLYRGANDSIHVSEIYVKYTIKSSVLFSIAT